MLSSCQAARGRGSRGYFLAPRQWFISLHQMENILIESLQLQEQPPQSQRHRKLFRVQIVNLSVVVNNFLCSRFVHLWPGQAPDKQMSHSGEMHPRVCLLTVVWKSMSTLVLFLWCLGVRGPSHLLLDQDNQPMLYPERDRCAEAREGGGMMVNKWCKT